MTAAPQEIIPKSTQEAVTFGLALLGATLGVLNFLRTLLRDHMRVRVSPRPYWRTDGGAVGPTSICVEVVNLSYFPVTISQIGFILRTDKKQMISPAMTFMRDQSLPHTLEARTAITAYFPAGTDQDENFGDVTAAFADTVCGRRFKGSSVFLRSSVKAARTA